MWSPRWCPTIETPDGSQVFARWEKTIPSLSRTVSGLEGSGELKVRFWDVWIQKRIGDEGFTRG